MINPWPLLEISLVWLCQASHVKYEYLPTISQQCHHLLIKDGLHQFQDSVSLGVKAA